MNAPQTDRSPELEQVRLMLFPHLGREDGWQRIETAFERAADRERSRRIERLADDAALATDLLSRLRRR